MAKIRVGARLCDGDDDCIVIERYLEGPDECPPEDIHVPVALAGQLMRDIGIVLRGIELDRKDQPDAQ